MKKVFCIVLIAIGIITITSNPTFTALADCTPVFDANGNFSGCVGGEIPPGEGGPGEEPGPVPCTPGTSFTRHTYTPADGGLCTHCWQEIDCTSGSALETGCDLEPGDCPEGSGPLEFPCVDYSFTAGGFSCDPSKWEVCASVEFPTVYLDARPFPASLVRWPTAVRNGGMTVGTGVGTLDYVAYGGGSLASASVGDWRNLVLTLTFNPAGPLYLSLPQAYLGPGDHPADMKETPFGTLTLPASSENGATTTIHWEVPSHPAAGGGPLAGSVPGFDELPGDMPVFEGMAYSPYKLFWALTWEQYHLDYYEECVSGPGSDGTYDCKTDSRLLYDDGHGVSVPYYEWRSHSKGGEILPSMVANLPVQLIAPGEVYWNYNTTIRRMNDANSVDDPVWARSWNWFDAGAMSSWGTIYWGVREGQGQIGWPGVP